MKKLKLLAAALAVCVMSACSQPADVASQNLSTAADNFEIERRIVFYNSITDTYLLEIIGRCSLGNFDGSTQKSVTCRTGPNDYKKHFLGLSDNVTYFVEQLEGTDVSPNRYRVVFRPLTIVPDPEIDFGGSE